MHYFSLAIHVRMNLTEFSTSYLSRNIIKFMNKYARFDIN